MNRTILQIPIDLALRQRAEQAAEKAGFSSVQEVVRVFLTKLASSKIEFGFHEPILTKAAEHRYQNMIGDIKKKKNITKANNLEELFSTLE